MTGPYQIAGESSTKVLKSLMKKDCQDPLKVIDNAQSLTGFELGEKINYSTTGPIML